MQQLEDEDAATIDALAAKAGPPPDTQRLSESEEDDFYAFEDRFVVSNQERLSLQLMTEGLPPEILSQLVIVKVRPDWAPLYEQPTQDAVRADMLIRAARFPLRWGLFDDVIEPKARVEKDERLHRRFQQRHTALQEQMAKTIITPSINTAAGAYSRPLATVTPPGGQMPEMGG